MRKFILIGIAAVMVAAPAAAWPTAAAGPTKLTVVMRDPGCHWFYLGGGPNHRRYATTVTRAGPVTLLNLDEDALKIKGPGGIRTERVGASLTLRGKGVYRIRMVGQEPDDKILKLTIK